MCNFLSAILTKDYEVFCQASLRSNSHEDIVKDYNLFDFKIKEKRNWLRVEFVPNGSVDGRVQWKYRLDKLANKEKLPPWYDERRAEEVVSSVATLKIKRLLGVEDIENFQGANLEGANFYIANLKETNLKGANLKGVGFYSTNLEGANLQGANLEWTFFVKANLEGANLKEANLSKANFERTNLQGTNLQGANLQGANLEGANLKGANLQGANLEGANFYNANLEGADFRGVDFQGAKFKGAKNV